MALVGVNRRRIQQLSRAEFWRECRKLNDEWVRAHCPTMDEMPRGMLARWLALREETERRGEQLHLF